MTWEHFRDVLPVVTLVLGYFGTTLTEKGRDRRTHRQRGVDAAIELQRTTTLEPQEALADHLGIVTRFLAEVEWDAGADDPPGPGRFDWHEREFAARARLSMLASRILDDEARSMTHQYMQFSANALSHADERIARKAWRDEAPDLCSNTIARLGELLRSSDPSR